VIEEWLGGQLPSSDGETTPPSSGWPGPPDEVLPPLLLAPIDESSPPDEEGPPLLELVEPSAPWLVTDWPLAQ
jgi:hypothetical protein